MIGRTDAHFNVPDAAEVKMKKKSKTEPKVGDWIRFEQGRKLVISEVRYMQMEPLLNLTIYVTDLGSVTYDTVLEVRRKA